MNKFQVYIIKNDINDKVYIGQTTQPINERFNGHWNNEESTVGRAMHELGKEHFSISILDDTASNLDELLEKERYFIQKFNSINNGYNTTMQKTSGRIHDRTRISSTLDNEIYRQLKQYADKSDIPITKILDRAVEMYLKSVMSKG